MSFDTTNKLLFDKKEELTPDDFLEFNPFLTMKMFSFYENGKFVDYVNDILNVYGFLFENKEDQLHFFKNVIPELSKKRINYIKRPKPPKDETIIPNNEFY